MIWSKPKYCIYTSQLALLIGTPLDLIRYDMWYMVMANTVKNKSDDLLTFLPLVIHRSWKNDSGKKLGLTLTNASHASPWENEHKCS